MGGYGSTRWGSYRRATRIEECFALDAGILARGGAANASTSGDVRWTDPQGRELAAIGWRRTDAKVELRYTVTSPGQPTREVSDVVRLERMPKPLGGFTWTWRCPRDLGGCPCGRRVLRLYLPPGRDRFGCRHCHGLAYTSSLRREEGLRRAAARLGVPELGSLLFGPPRRAGRRKRPSCAATARRGDGFRAEAVKDEGRRNGIEFEEG
jgi:hypothetical protein